MKQEVVVTARFDNAILAIPERSVMNLRARIRKLEERGGCGFIVVFRDEDETKEQAEARGRQEVGTLGAVVVFEPIDLGVL
jgi:hypothetical protein